MLELNFSPFPELETERLLLRNIADADVDDIFEIRSNPQTMQYIPRPIAKTKEDAMGLINMLRGFNDNNEKLNWGVIDKNNGKMIGIFGYVNFFTNAYRGEVGYVLHQDYHGTGVATEALKVVLDYGFEQIGLHSIEAVIRTENMKSQKLVEKFGFTKDAYFKDYIYHNEQFWDAVVYSLIKL